MSILLNELHQMLKAIFPLVGQKIPNEPKRVQPLLALFRHLILVHSLKFDPLPKSKPFGIRIILWNSAMAPQF